MRVGVATTTAKQPSAPACDFLYVQVKTMLSIYFDIIIIVLCVARYVMRHVTYGRQTSPIVFD
jgi:hypothetical protein